MENGTFPYHLTLKEDIKFAADLNQIDPEKSGFWVLLTSLFLFILWVTFLTFYFSRVLGLVVSFAANRYLRWTKNLGNIKVGSFSISLLGGKIMIKDLVYANNNFSIRINDAWIIFSYWRCIPGKEINYTDQSSRLHISLNGFQIHWYNRVERYKEIAQLFGMERFFIGEEIKRVVAVVTQPPGTVWDRFWALVGQIRLDIWSGRCVIGNKLLPYMFVLSWENLQSKVKIFESTNDRCLVSVEGQMESIRGAFEKYPDYEGEEYKDPPRTMGEGFAILQSASMSFYYHQDILDFVTQPRQSIEKNERPLWESIWRFGPNTVVSYGPWAEFHRALIWKFFFPADYQTPPVTELPQKGQRRVYIMHDVRISFLKESSIDIWFNRGEQLESIHTRCQAGSTIEMSIWWILNEEGFSTSANFNLLNVVSTTSLLYRKLFECETLRVDSSFQYPRVFNAKQVWSFKYNISKATMWFVWDHKRFFTDLINEWTGESPADLLQFIPYEVHTDISVSDGFEMILLLNNGNWVDPSEMQSENVECCIVGEKLSFNNVMPFVDFLPETYSHKYTILGENEMAMRMKHPLNSATAPLLAMLTRAAHHLPYASKSTHGTYSNNEHWHECWRTERVSMIFDYRFHPHMAHVKTALPYHILQEWTPKKVEHPKDLVPDYLSVFIELEGSELQMTGLLIRFILDLKNNYFGFYDSMTDITLAETLLNSTEKVQGMFNRVPPNALPELYRPMNVDVELRVHNIRAHCLLHSMGGAEPEPCPVLYTEELVLEMKKSHDEMILQVGVGQCAVHFERATIFQPDGFLSLNGLQFRGQALLSSKDVPWDMAIVEYAWQVEVLVGELTGSLEVPSHLYALYQIIETVLLFGLAKDDETIIPDRFSACQHGNLMNTCPRADGLGKICEGEDRLKYRQVRVCVDGVKLALCDEKSIIDVTLDPIRFTLCNAHESRFTEHLAVRIPTLLVRQVIRCEGENAQWLEVAKIFLDGISLDLELPLPEDGEHLEKARLKFVKAHDEATKRLYFLYSQQKVWECACYGRTRFFGKEDTIGENFLSSEDRKPHRLFVPKINETGQIGVHQSMLREEEWMLRPESHLVYPNVKRDSTSSLPANPQSNSAESSSFHSAVSHQKETLPSQSRLLMVSYGSYLTRSEVIKPFTEPPKLGKPGALRDWAANKVVQVIVKPMGVGMNALQIRTSAAKRISSAEAIAAEAKLAADVPCNRLAIHGSVADNLEIFVTPLAVEVADRLANSIVSCTHKLNPAFLIQHTYLNCVLKGHRQPLTENLFHSKPRPLKWDISLELPKIQVSLFQCGIADTLNGPPAVATNICLVMVDKASISTAKDQTKAGWHSLSLQCGIVTAQLLHLVEKSDRDFLAARTPFRSKVNWEESEIGKRLPMKDLRVIMDAHIPNVNATYENQRPVIPSGTPSNAPIFENKIKVAVGTVRNCVVMARPLEKTAKNEFPLYDALSPAITAWLNVAQRLDATVDKLKMTQGHWDDMSFARMMKLALECPDESILGAKGKNKMDAVKLLGKHQASCPTCLLLKVLMRWYSLPESAKQLAAPLTLKVNFDTEKARKTALMALLSHWHPDICQMVKLASNAEAVRFRADPGEKKKEVRINIEGNVMETRHRRNGSAASRNLAKEAVNPADGHSKLDLYSYIRSAHREWNERKKNTSTPPKDYVNPMDIIPQAFFYSFYRTCKLDWTNLDGVPLDRLTFAYDLLVSELAVDLVEPKLFTSPTADSSQKLLAPCVHNLVSIRKINVAGDVSWIIEMDEKKLMPIRGKAHLTYRGQVENVQFVVAIASICLAKEVILVGKSAGDTLTELRSHPSVPLTPASTRSNESITAKSGNFGQQTWDEKVYDMMRDYEKNVQRTGAMHRGDILTAVHGQGQIADVRLESRLTDLYVSFDMKSIDFTQEHNPVPVGRNTAVPHETDRLNVTLRKAKLNIRQSLSDGVKNNESKPILLCSLKESTANLNRRHLVITGLASSYDTSLAIALGPIEGELPMSAGSLHEVVMKHGPQLEMEFDRLSAQPQGASFDQGAGVLSVEVVSPVEGGSWHKGGPPMNLVRQKPPATPIIKVQFKIKLESIELQAQILPSLQAVYKMSHATSQGETGGKANWNASIKHHYAEFNVTDKLKDSFTLELPSIDVIGEYLGEDGERKEQVVEKKGGEKVLQYRKGGFLKMEVALGRVNHSFTTELLNRILFATQSFRAELASLVRSQKVPDTRPAPVVISTSSADKSMMLFHVTVKGVTKANSKEPWLQLTAATPTATAARFTIDELQMELTNRLVREGSEKFVGIGLIQFSAKLGQLVRAVSYEETPAELQEYATFMTMIRVSNEESSSQTHSYHISLNRPYMMIKSSAVDKAILLWLNYKNMYDYWREERVKFEKSLEKEKRRNSISQVMFSPQPSQDFDINLSLSIVGGMYVCMPLVSHDITDGMPALVLSLQKSEVSVSIKKELACQAQFHGFKLNFINNFDDVALMNFQKESTAGEVMSNFFFFPQGSYKLCSKASNDGGDAKWVLSVRSHMCGMIIDLDQRIGKLAKMLVNTISSLGEEEHFHEFNMHSDRHEADESEEYWIEGANELATLQQPEQRVRWMEQQMHRQLRELSDLTIRKADEAQLEAARKKLRQYELLRFKEFRKTMVEKLKRSNDKGGSSSRRQSNASLLPEHSPLVKKISNARSDDGRRDDVVNMHIDVQVNIESGACTLRTSPTEQNVLAKRPSAKDLRAKNILAPQVHFTKFSIPSVDLKGYYVSEPNTMPLQAHPLVPTRPPAVMRNSKDLKAPNRGCFYLSVALASMPSETVVTPHLADFVEQVLEPLPISTGAMSVNSTTTLDDGADPVNNIVGIDTSALPLDVIFHLSVQSSTIRFDGQQQRTSAADCLLKLPSLTLMGSTKRSDGSEYPGGIDISCTLTAFSLSIYSPHQQTTAHDALSLTLDHLCFVISRSKNSSNDMHNKVRFVLTSEIGTANFNYDMRRLSELLAFPKPWFRKAIARRVFFGDQTGTLKTPDASKHSTLVSNHYTARNTGDIHEKPWSATVFLTVQWKELNVNAQMSNTMGTTSWITRKGLLRSLAKLTSRHERDITLTFKLDGSELVAHGGAISGEVSLKELELELKHKRDAKRAPRNNARIKLGSFETRVEWMSRVILIGRCKQPAIMLGDDFEELKNRDGEVNRVNVALNLKFSWEDLQLAITRTTIDDFQKIVNKLKLFFTEQLKNSRKVWTFDDEVEAPVMKKQDVEAEDDEEDDSKISRWEKVLDLVTEIQYNLKLLAYPSAGETTVGGSVEFEAGRISVACMNGDMTSSSWALFNLRNPSILFSPEAQFYFVNKEAGVIGVSCRQRLIIRIGDVPSSGQVVMKNAGFDDRVENMANVCQVKQAKGSVMRQNSSIATSLDYLIGDVLKESKLAPLITPTGPEQPKQISHELTVLFHFPSLEVALTSLQNMECTDEEPSPPIVQSSFLTDFYGAVHLNTDFNAQVHFLPDLIKSYTKASQGSSSTMATSSQQEEAIEKKDKRIYQCDTWEFFPEIKFMEKGHSWTPPLVTDILKKLNVYDHRRTIPKVLQRFLLDTLDAALANGILQMLKLVDRSEEKRV